MASTQTLEVVCAAWNASGASIACGYAAPKQHEHWCSHASNVSIWNVLSLLITWIIYALLNMNTLLNCRKQYQPEQARSDNWYRFMCEYITMASDSPICSTASDTLMHTSKVHLLMLCTFFKRIHANSVLAIGAYSGGIFIHDLNRGFSDTLIAVSSSALNKYALIMN